MTESDKPAFVQAIGQLAVALREREPDVVQMRVYFAALQDLPIEFVSAAADQLVAHAQWFPKPSEWRDMAAGIERTRTEAQRARLRRLPAPLCPQCDDTGWAQAEEPGRVRPCACRAERRLELLGRRPWPQLPESTTQQT